MAQLCSNCGIRHYQKSACPNCGAPTEYMVERLKEVEGARIRRRGGVPQEPDANTSGCLLVPIFCIIVIGIWSSTGASNTSEPSPKAGVEGTVAANSEASTKGTNTDPKASAEEGEVAKSPRKGLAGIVVYRPPSMTGEFFDVKVYRLDEQGEATLLASLSSGQKFFYETEPGEVLLRSSDRSPFSSKEELRVSAKMDTVVYLRAAKQSNFASVSTPLVIDPEGEANSRSFKWAGE